MDRSESQAPPLPPRPREKLALLGASSLADDELVALVLGGGRAILRAREALCVAQGLEALGQLELNELTQVPGLGLASAAGLCAAFELGRRARVEQLAHLRYCRDPDAVAACVRALIGRRPQEVFAVVGLDARQAVRLWREVAVGSLASVDVHPREVFRPLIRAGIHSVVLCHNHPSDDPAPSAADVDLTHRMAEVGRLVGIPVVDHVVVGRENHVSLARAGLLVPPGAASSVAVCGDSRCGDLPRDSGTAHNGGLNILK